MNVRNPQRLYARHLFLDDDIVRSAWRHAEVGRNDQPAFLGGNSMLVQTSFEADRAVVAGSNNQCLRSLRHSAAVADSR